MPWFVVVESYRASGRPNMTNCVQADESPPARDNVFTHSGPHSTLEKANASEEAFWNDETHIDASGFVQWK